MTFGFEVQCAIHYAMSASNDQLFDVYNVPGDIDCFFHCLSFGIHGDFNSTGIFRNLICGSVYNIWSDWAEKVNICHSPNMTKELYFEAMINGHWWATACEFEAASNLLDTTINRVQNCIGSGNSVPY